MFTAQILLVDHFVTVVDGVELSCCQFFFVTAFSLIGSLLFEHPTWAGLTMAAGAILYAGLLSSGVGYTLQILAQKGSNPTVISLLLSLESVFATISGRGDLGRPPQRAGIFRLRPDAGSGGAGATAGQEKSINPACFFGSGACWLRFFRGHLQRYVLYFNLYEYGIHN